jgi:hypothetical protein
MAGKYPEKWRRSSENHRKILISMVKSWENHREIWKTTEQLDGQVRVFFLEVEFAGKIM